MKLIKHFKFAVFSLVFAGFSAAHAGSYEDFFVAITRDNAGHVDDLLKRGFDPNTRNPDGQTGLYLALRADSLKAADALIAGPGLEVDARNAVGETALMIAALRGQMPQVQALLQHGAQVNQPGWSALHYAVSGPNLEVVKLLADRGAALDATSPNGSTPLMMAARYGSEAAVDLLLARGADPRKRNELGLGAADFAKLGGRESLAARLAPLASR